jgi:hypothetical protein
MRGGMNMKDEYIFEKYKTGSIATEEIDKSIEQVKDCKRKIKHRKGLYTKITFGLMASMALVFGGTGFVFEATRSNTPLPDICGYERVTPEEDLDEASNNIGKHMALGASLGLITALIMQMRAGEAYFDTNDVYTEARNLNYMDKELDRSLEDLEKEKKKKLIKRLD